MMKLEPAKSTGPTHHSIFAGVTPTPFHVKQVLGSISRKNNEKEKRKVKEEMSTRGLHAICNNTEERKINLIKKHSGPPLSG